ncbi:MAG: hypothetical protein QM692_03855 [Thermomicrobiales bacterium]
MDDRRFDLLARALSEAVGSRRETLRTALAGTIAGVVGVSLASGESEAKDRDRNKKHRRRRKRTKKYCICPDNNQKNCSDKQLTQKKWKRVKKKNPNSFRGKCGDRCLDNDTECNTNRPGECCSEICCRDVTSTTGGICSTSGGNCCNRPNQGGYCPAGAPFCCGTAACCASSTECCASALNPTGTCCPSGFTCDQYNGFCIPAAGVESRDAEVADPTVARIRAGS